MTETTAMTVFGDKSLSAVNLARQAVSRLAVNPTPENWIMAEGMFKQLREFTSEFGVAFRENFAAYLEEHGDIEVGDGRRMYAGKVKKVTRKIEPAALFDAMMEAAGGDLDRVATCLSVNFAKPAEVRELSPELYERSYAEEFVLDVKTGKPKREPRLTR